MWNEIKEFISVIATVVAGIAIPTLAIVLVILSWKLVWWVSNL
jgi:hypothetical protein